MARLDHQPYFTFKVFDIGEHSSNPILYALNRTGALRLLRGQAELFVLAQSAKGEPRRILIDNFYEDVNVFHDKGEVSFSYIGNLTYPKFLGFDIKEVTESGKDVTLHFETMFPAELSKPIAAEPEYDRVVDIEKHRKQRFIYDWTAIRNEIQSSIDDLAQR